MPFLTRNRYHLRVSSSKIIPLYVYLDSQHVDWMSDQILRKVVADLRPKVGPKLRAEYGAHLGQGPAPASAKRGTVDVHRGDTYQFAYFLRESEPYSVLLRNFVLAPEPRVTKSDAAPTVTEKKAGKQKKGTSKKKRRKARGGRATEQNGEDEDDYNPSDSGLRDDDDLLQADEEGDIEIVEDLDASTSKGTRRAIDPTATCTNESSHVEDTVPIVVDDDEEPKPKLALDLKYRTFPNFNRCLCVVVEPWPSQTSGSHSRAPSLAPSTTSRAPSVAPTISEFSTNRGQRARTPLFLPDLDDESLIPGHSRFREWDGSSSLMQFSQMLSATGRAGGADVEEEEEFDGTALFADADEAKEL
ncbi:hypothetical protein BGY98DRAFT_1183677 [Russula aff. rugulosa BPL654]|nr:hypothetical protein BGY98DRAFT_1183677 [Russula aff. rugulosa BPL654]